MSVDADGAEALPGERCLPLAGAGLPTLVDIPTLADFLGVNVRHVRRFVAERRIPYFKVGNFIRFDPNEIVGWLELRHRRPAD